MDRNNAENILKNTFGFNSFHDQQWKTIDALLKGERVLLIEKSFEKYQNNVFKMRYSAYI